MDTERLPGESMVITSDSPAYITPANIGIYPDTGKILFCEGASTIGSAVVEITPEGFFYNSQYIADAGEAHTLLLKVLRMYPPKLGV